MKYIIVNTENKWMLCGHREGHMVAIIAESTFRESGWGIELFTSLTDALRNRRIPFCEVYDAIPPESDGVFILGTDHIWLRDVIGQLNRRGILPILIGNQAEQLSGCQYNCICPDVSGSMKHLLTQIGNEGRQQIAMYDVNTNSIADLGRVDILFSEKTNPPIPSSCSLMKDLCRPATPPSGSISTKLTQ